MLTPYDWQEGIGHRAQYIEARLGQGTPILAVALSEGILLATYKRRANKIYEIYDRMIFGGLGQQSDVEALRVAAIEFAHQEGYNRSEQDVTIQRLIAGLSGSLKKAFADFSASPVVARSLFAEVGETLEGDRFYILDYDGDFTTVHGCAVVAGDEEVIDELRAELSKIDAGGSVDSALATLREIAQKMVDRMDFQDELSFEAVLLERSDEHENRFRILERSE